MYALYLDIGDMTLGQGHDTPLVHGQKLCEIVGKKYMFVSCYPINPVLNSDPNLFVGRIFMPPPDKIARGH